VGWGGTATRQSAASAPAVPASPEAMVPTPAVVDTGAEAPHEEILELGLAPSVPRPKTSRPVMAAKRESLPPSGQGGLAIYEKGKLIYGAPVADPDQQVTRTTPQKPQFLSREIGDAAANAPAGGSVRAVQISPEIAENLLLNRIEPEYPDAARRARAQGTVTMEALIGADGKVQLLTPTGGNPQLADAAMAAVRQWRYKPYTVGGRKVAVRTQVYVTFMLAE
jgi:TonB family protein